MRLELICLLLIGNLLMAESIIAKDDIQEKSPVVQTDQRWHNLTSIFFLDSVNGWLVDLYSKKDSSILAKVESNIYMTKDGGKTWLLQCSIPYFIGKLAFIDATHGWALDGPNDIIAKTNDGGKTWSIYNSSGTVTTKSRIQKASIISTRTELVILSSESVWAITNGRLFTTNNGGLNWQEHKEIEGIVSATHISAKIGFGLGANGRIYRSDDAGGSWYTIPARFNVAGVSLNELQSSGSLQVIRFIDEKRGWILRTTHGTDATLYTEDGGQSWTAKNIEGVHPSNKPFFYVGDAELKQGYGWAAGANERGEYVILRLDRNRWTQQFSGKPPAVIFSLSGASPYIAWVIVDKKTIWKLSIEQERLGN